MLAYFRHNQRLSLMTQHLDLSTVEAFVLTTDLRSFTQAADVLGLTQAAVSLKVSRLERALNRRLLIRTPRSIQLSPDGEVFLPRARTLLVAQQLALVEVARTSRRLRLGISDHVAGPELPSVLEKIKSYDPGLAISVRVGASSELLAEYDREEIDVAIVRSEKNRRDAEPLFEDRYGWFASLSMRTRGEPMPLVTVDDACGIRSIATRLLAQAGIEWSDSFIGGGVATALYAAAAGIGVAPLPVRLASSRLIDVGEGFQLPPLPNVAMVMYSRHMDAHTRESLRILAGAFRGINLTHLA
ncbi:LysR family transcriptional regulator [Pseudomonas graminis]|uniref:LysR family transcriptional regulator n=1 Tax=Pseudomonas graminis TaxID=158627 RepID=UPI001AAF64F7|nr:LysR family transcriptional regulator [Pseudomonas graminis]